MASVCVVVHKCTSSCLLLLPKGNGLQTEQGLGEGALKALTVGFPLLMIFLLVFCLLGILPVLYICILYTVVSLFLSVCCILCSVKHWSREVLLAGFVWLLRVTRESDWRACFCEHQGEETLCVFFLLGGKFDQLQVTPAAVKPYCLYAPVVWLVSSYGLVSDFCVRCRVNRAKKILRHGLQHAAMIIPIPKPQDPLRYAWFIPHKENSKEGRPGRLAAIAA